MNEAAAPAACDMPVRRPMARQSRYRLQLLCSIAWLGFALPAQADELPTLPRNTFGGVGLVEMPSARLAPDGEMSVSAAFMHNTQHYTLGFQMLPWLETSFRYSGLKHFEPTFSIYYDRSLALKARLFNETRYTPALAIGINDVVGTGVYSGEYLVASKQFGDFDTSLGIGWGRMGSTDLIRNPLILFSNSLKSRGGLATAGGTNFGQLFHGQRSGLFGGVVWHAPILEGLSFIAEYSSDAYTLEASRASFVPRNQANFGINYQPTDSISLGFQWLYGRSIGGNVAFILDPTKPQFEQKIVPAIPPPAIRSAESQRQALEGLLGREQMVGRSSANAGPFTRARFSDALWSGDSQHDVRIAGRTVFVSASEPEITQEACARLALSAQQIGALDRIVLTAPAGTKRTCVVSPTVLVETLANINPAPGQFVPGNLKVIDGRPLPEAVARQAAVKAIRDEAKRQDIEIAALSIQKSDLIVYYNNGRYFSETDAVERLTRVLMANAPPEVERFRLVAVVNGLAQRQFEILRTPMERALSLGDSGWGFSGAITADAPPSRNPVLALADRHKYPQFQWGIFPIFRQSLFDPNQPFGAHFLLGAGGSIELLRGLSLNAEIESSLYESFATNRPSDSLLPHVRSDLLKYLNRGKNGIGSLEADYRFKITPEVSAIVRAGYLESMFGGAGGEVLWRPSDSRWAFGFDIYGVQQRNYDRLFGLLDYRTVTGLASIYYQSPWYGLNIAVRGGRYLAGDYGATFELTRRFSTGVEIGAFFTRTNVSAEQFGEGSFDKGIIIRIPIGWIGPIESQSQVNIDLRPVQRDGGQRLGNDTVLFEETRRTSTMEMALQQEALK